MSVGFGIGLAITIMVVLFSALLWAYARGLDKQKLRDKEKSLENVKEAKSVEDEIRRTPDAVVTDKLSKWRRD